MAFVTGISITLPPLIWHSEYQSTQNGAIHNIPGTCITCEDMMRVGMGIHETAYVKGLVLHAKIYIHILCMISQDTVDS